MEKQEAPIRNTPFSEKELDHFRHLLEVERKKSQEKVESYESQLEDMEKNLDDTSSSASHHQGNIGTSEDEREKYYIMIEKEKEKQEEINMALNRIETGNYGICKVTGNPIQKERLEAKPYAKYSIDAKKGDN
ncbi:TraR/DksA family transcriptional regulator [Gracilimonas sp.]|uniref:TraR/DksA family transcriptional regulator n=1 Tax=Gracilimonas sp. TaxID=1974203 RepID=UPI002872345A|nr:TraR/DksA C4-type zinc finger protein [Gracilimonas sp.]